jgi:hypothetical protein
MGSCSSSESKDTEIDLYIDKHHKRNEIFTNKDHYEISKQQFSLIASKVAAKKISDDILINDEKT